MKTDFKKMMIVLTGFFALSLPQAYAGTMNDNSWNQILKNTNLTVEAPQIFFGSNLVSVLDICISGESIQPKKPYVKACAAGSPILDDGSCAQEVVTKLSRPITSMEADCGDAPEYGCPADAPLKPVTIPLIYSLEVYHGQNLTPDYENATNLLFAKDYALPACQ